VGTLGRTFAPGHFDLELDGTFAGSLINLQGGEVVAEVVQEKAGADHIARKTITGVRFNDIVVTFAGGMSKDFYDWIRQASLQKALFKNGAIGVFDFQGKAQRHLEWSHGVLTEVDFPALDAGSKEPFEMVVKITPETARSVSGNGKAAASKAQKHWLRSSFRLKIDGLEEACKSVSKIEPVSLKTHVTRDSIGSARDFSRIVIEQTDPSNLLITLPQGKAKPFADWFQSFVIEGRSTPENEKSGTLECGLFRLDFRGLGPLQMKYDKSDASKDSIDRVMLEMYCQSIAFSTTGN